MTSKHTPTPWVMGNMWDHYDEKSKKTLSCMNILPPENSTYIGEICGLQSADHINGISHSEAIANAEFIVKAVNNHDALVSALENMIKYLKSSTYRCPSANMQIESSNRVLSAIKS